MKRLHLAGLLVKFHRILKTIYQYTNWQWIFEIARLTYNIASDIYDEDRATYRRQLWIEKTKS